MKITNKHGIPSGLAKALAGDEYDLLGAPKNILSVTSMLSSPKVRQLERRHWDEIESDVSEAVFRIMGQATHERISRYDKGENKLTEERWYMNLETLDVYTLGAGEKITKQEWYNKDTYFLSGRFDSYEQTSDTDGVVDDYKVTSVWGVIIDGAPKPDYVSQLNVYAYALRKIGFPATKARSILILRDWSAAAQMKNPANYPPIPIHVWDIPLWKDDDVEGVIRAQVRRHVRAEDLADDEIPECTPLERWAKNDQWALMKDGRKSAVKLYDTEDAAITAKLSEEKASPKNSYYIEKREGGNVKCERYCNSGRCGFCNFYNDNVK